MLQAFPDGIYWLTVGQKPNVLDLQNQLLRQLTGLRYEDSFRGCPVNLLHSQNEIFSRGPNHFFSYSHPECKPLAKRLGEMRRPANQSPQFMASLRGEARAALAGLDQ
jgi:hypothetical protein